MCDAVFRCKYHCGLSISSLPCLNVNIPGPNHSSIKSNLCVKELHALVANIWQRLHQRNFLPNYHVRHIQLYINACERADWCYTIAGNWHKMYFLMSCKPCCDNLREMCARGKLIEAFEVRSQYVLDYARLFRRNKSISIQEWHTSLNGFYGKLFEKLQPILRGEM